MLGDVYGERRQGLERVERMYQREDRRWKEVVVIPGGTVKRHDGSNDTNLPQCGMSVVSSALDACRNRARLQHASPLYANCDYER